MSKQEIAAAMTPLISRVRTDVSWVKRDGKQSRTNEPITEARLVKHLNGGPARGVVPMQPGQSVTMVALLDFDSHKGQTSWPDMQTAAKRVMSDLLAVFGLEPIPFRSSGGKGIHLFMLWDEPQDAYSVRWHLTEVLRRCGFTNGPGGVSRGEIEVFPKQNQIAVGAYGNQFILPLAGESVPLDGDLGDLPREFAPLMDWPMSAPVPLVDQPAPRASAVSETPELDVLRACVRDGITNSGDKELSYDKWRDAVFAIHSATCGSDEGLALAEELSSKASKCDLDFLRERVWPYITEREGGVTVRTLYSTAHEQTGWTEPIPDVFEVITSQGETEPEPLPNFERDKKGGIEATVNNTVLALRRPDVCGMRVAYDAFRDEITVAQPGTDGWRPMTDADAVRLRIALERVGFKSAPKELARDAAVLVASENTYDSAQLWLGGLKHDGKKRVERFLIDYMGCEDTPYTRAVGLYMWTALAGRVMQPGVKADMVPIYEGDQGLRKSSAIEALSPAPEYFAEIDLAEKEEDTVRKLRGVLVGEIAELSGLHTRALESIKKFVVRKHEKWVPKYKEFPTTFARRLLFIGTTNRTDILADDTGNRRWLPLHITLADIDGIVRDRDQLWAEGAALFAKRGVCWQQAEGLAPTQHDAYTIEDSWSDAVNRWLVAVDPMATDGVQLPNGELPFTTADALRGALGVTDRDMDKLAANRMGAILRTLGFEQKTARINGVPTRAWKKRIVTHVKRMKGYENGEA